MGTIPVTGKNAGYQSEISKLQNILSRRKVGHDQPVQC